jgi:quercetin dioxygenase-like cupin family protein
VEFLYMIRGKIDLVIGSDTHTLDTGDTIYFDSSVRHGYRRTGGHPSTGLIITVP